MNKTGDIRRILPLLLCLVGSPAFPQSRREKLPPVPGARRISLNLRKTDLTTAIQTLLTEANVNYIYAPGDEPSPTFSLELRQATFEQAFDRIRKTVNAPSSLTYRVVKGIVVLFPLPASQPSTEWTHHKVWLRLKRVSLDSTLRAVFSLFPFRFMLAKELRNYRVNAAITGLSFNVALERLLKSTGKPLTYSVDDNNTYHFARPTGEEYVPMR
jgi:hypothetical protein